MTPKPIAACFAILFALYPGLSRGQASSATDRGRILCFHTQWINYADRADKQTLAPLFREFPRQAMLIAARDELGLAAHDETLGETMFEDDRADHLLCADRAIRPERVNHVRLLKFAAADTELSTTKPSEQTPLWEKGYAYRPGVIVYHADFVPTMELASRTDFVDALKAAGYSKAPRSAGVISQEIEATWQARLLEPDMVTQLAVVRECHQAIASSGETEQRLGVLVRGYANLSLLTNHHWNFSTYAFAARSLLYAQRMVAAGGDSPSDFALQHRAYAWSVVGFHHNAIADYENLMERDAVTEPWAWLGLLYCEFDRDGFVDLAEDSPELRAWATRLRCQLILSLRYPDAMYRAGREIAQTVPTAYGVYGEMARYGGTLATTRSGASYAPRSFAHFLPVQVNKIPNLPEQLAQLSPESEEGRKQLQKIMADDPNPNDRFWPIAPAYADRFRQAEDNAAGLSWSALASLLDEEFFVQVANHFKVSMVAVESSKEAQVKGVLPLIEGHRYAGYIESYRYNARRQPQQIKEVVKDLVYRDPRDLMRPMFDRLRGKLAKEHTIVAGHDASMTWDESNFQGLVESTGTYGLSTQINSLSWARRQSFRLSKIIPNSELGIRVAISSEKKPPLEKLKQWDAVLEYDVESIKRLGVHYRRLGARDDAIRCFERALEIMPTYSACSYLARLYRDEHNIEQWEATLLDYLKQRDSTNGAYFAQLELSGGYYAVGDFENARKYALEAAQVWGTISLGSASLVHEAIGDWKQSEYWIREKSVNYPSGYSHEWYFWCCRTGRGDRDAAREHAKGYFNAPPSKPSKRFEVNLGTHHLLEGRLEQARDAYLRVLEMQSLYTATFMVAQLSRKLDDEQTRTKVIRTFREELAKREEPESDPTRQAGVAVLDLLEHGKVEPATLRKLEELLEEVPLESTRAAFAYFAANELDALGEKELAVKLWTKALRMPSGDFNYSTLAGHELSKLHGTSRPDGDELTQDDFWGKRTYFGQGLPKKAQAPPEQTQAPPEKTKSPPEQTKSPPEKAKSPPAKTE